AVTREVASDPVVERSLFTTLKSGQPQTLVRSINEQLCRISGGDNVEEDVEIMCECIRPGCFQRVPVSRTDSENVRLFPTRFILKLEHLSETSERTVDIRA